MPDASKIGVGEWLERWLDGKHDLSPVTKERYAAAISKAINPTLGEIELQQLKPLHVRAWLAELLKTRSGRTVGNLCLVLNGALKEAVRLELIGRNPASAVTPPRSKSDEITILSEVDVCEGSA